MWIHDPVLGKWAGGCGSGFLGVESGYVVIRDSIRYVIVEDRIRLY